MVIEGRGFGWLVKNNLRGECCGVRYGTEQVLHRTGCVI